MANSSRRRFLARAGAATLGALTALRPGAVLAAGDQRKPTFGFGTYGTKGLKTEHAIEVLAGIGYDSVELMVRSGWDADPENLSRLRRLAIRKQFSDRGLKLTSLMEHQIPHGLDDEGQHAAQLERLQRVAEFGHTLSPKDPPVVQTVLGGGDWEEKKGLFLKRLADWARVGEQTETVFCIKPHRGGAMSLPSQAAWLIRKLDTKWIRMVYDYSHYAFRGTSIAETVQNALPVTAHVALKDVVRKGNGTRFVLPGEAGTVDYVEILRRFHAGGYRGDYSCEVSSQVWRQEGYDPVAAAKTCYQNLAPLFAKAGVERAGASS